ncbi:MAG: hypothetical protein AAF802_19455 [Planctomycetota bacterium]
MTRRLLCFAVSAATLAAGWIAARPATAQTQAILSEVYGRGVHAYYAGRYDEAYSLLSSAIAGGSKDPRAYYFRGIVSNSRGSVYEAEADWMQGAQLEARSGDAISIGRSLSRFQGSQRLKLEGIRQQAKLEAMTTAKARSDQRRSELGLAVPGTAPAASKPAAPLATPAPAAPAATDPFADDVGMAAGKPRVESDDALKGLDGNPFKDDPAPAAAGAAAPAMDDGPSADPFANPSTDDPFANPAGGADPFSGGGGSDDPFADPFGG